MSHPASMIMGTITMIQHQSAPRMAERITEEAMAAPGATVINGKHHRGTLAVLAELLRGNISGG